MPKVKVNLISGTSLIPVEYLECRAFIHEILPSHIFQETVNGVVRWVARSECGRCGTLRKDVMLVKSFLLVSREYLHPDNYPTTLSKQDAKTTYFNWLSKRNNLKTVK